jgi:hypothetical protein
MDGTRLRLLVKFLLAHTTTPHLVFNFGMCQDIFTAVAATKKSGGGKKKDKKDKTDASQDRESNGSHTTPAPKKKDKKARKFVS